MTTFGSEVLDVRSPDLTNPVVAADVRAPRGVPLPPVAGLSNARRLREAIDTLLARTTTPAPSFSVEPVHDRIRGGILYFPPGKYLIDDDLPAEWRRSLLEMTEADRIQATAGRNINPFAASVQFPKEITVWLAPGAVLVPARGAVVYIESPLICGRGEVFDTLQGGMVLFGRGTPSILANWWGIFPGEDHARSIQAALDAGINHRAMSWEVGGDWEPFPSARRVNIQSASLPPIPVELEGDFHLRRPVRVRPLPQPPALLERLGAVAFRNPAVRPMAAALLGGAANTVIRGLRSGRSRQGARLIMAKEFAAPNPASSGRALLEALETSGLSIRDVAFEVHDGSGPDAAMTSCLKLSVRDDGPPLVMQGISVRGCSFTGQSNLLLQLGPLPPIDSPGSATEPTTASTENNYGSDMSSLCIDECTFRCGRGGIGVAIRTSQTVPFRFRGCDLHGDGAAAMIEAWEATFLLEDWPSA